MDREWIDKRMDDFADRVGRFEGNVDKRFDKVDERFERFERNVDQQFGQAEVVTKERFDRAEDVTNERFDKADALEKERFAAVHAELVVASRKADKMNWTLIGGFVSIFVTIVGKILLG
jgi:hypothetical protein